jgi:hypothetical protein
MSDDDLKVTSKAMQLPAWMIIPLIGFVALAAESRIKITYMQGEVARIEKQIERDKDTAARDFSELRMAIGRLQLQGAAICAKLGADCPK